MRRISIAITAVGIIIMAKEISDSEIASKCLKFIRDSRQHTIVRDQEDRAKL